MIIDSYDIRPKSCLTRIIILISSGLHCKSQKDCKWNALAHLKRAGACVFANMKSTPSIISLNMKNM